MGSCALLGGFAISALDGLLWQHTRLMRNVSEDACTRCTGGFLFLTENFACNVHSSVCALTNRYIQWMDMPLMCFFTSVHVAK